MTEEPAHARDYRPEIDGLRAVAVIPVVLFHLGLDWLRGGYLGVDVFFVISGFLITSIVLGDLRSGRFTFRDFWARRIRRIFPPLIVMVGCTLLAAWILTPPFDHPAVGRQAVAALLSIANVHFWRSAGDYWGLQAEQMPLLHTWSLSVEEQFYLLFPPAIWLIHRWRRSGLSIAPLVVAAGSFALFLYGLKRSPTAAFYLLPTRAWELAMGCALATVSGPSGHGPSAHGPSAVSPWRSWLAVGGLGLILASYCLFPVMNAGAAVTVLATAVVLAFSRSGPCRAILSLPPLVHVGRLSYSLYLWHWPFLVFAGHPNVVRSPWLACGLSCLAAAVSYEWIEKPTRRRPGILPAIAVGYVVVLGLSVAMMYSGRTYDTTAFHRPVTHSYSFDIGDPGGAEYRRAVARAGKTHDLPPPTFPADAWRTGGIVVGSSLPPRLVVIGDSHGAMWSHVIRAAAEKLDLSASFYSAIGISPFVPFPPEPRPPAPSADAAGFDRDRLQAARLGFIGQWHPDIVIVCARWSNYRREDAVALLTFLGRHAGRTLLIEQPPELAITDRCPMQWLAYQGVRPEPGRQVSLAEGNRKAYERGRSLVRELAAEFPRCTVVPVGDLYRHDAEVLVLDGDDVLYLDEDHLTDFGTERAAARIESAILEALPPADDRAAPPP